MHLTEIANGISTFDENKLVLPARVASLTIAVHPYFLVPDLTRHPTSETLAGIERHLKDAPAAVVLEEVHKLYGVAETIHRLGNPRIYFIETNLLNPTPLFATWDDVAEFTRGFKTARTYIIGGLYFKAKLPIDRGCLGYAKQQLEDRGIRPELVPSAIFPKTPGPEKIRRTKW